MNEIEIKHVFKHYPVGNKEKFTALSDINVSFKKGELVSIVGESGSGKSTLMNLIGGLDSDFEGDIIVGGMNLRSQPDKVLDKYRKNKVGFVFQSFNLIPHLSILDNVTIALTLSNVSEKIKVEKATKILTRLGLEKELKRKPTQLSGGQKQRVAIARALINDPDIILADEPTGALDTGTTSQILEIMKEIADEGKLVIMVTHSEKVASISSRVVEISDGKIIRDEKNKAYKKNRTKRLELAKSENRGEKQNLAISSAIRLAFHNMWASKTKNFLMAFGVAISIVSLIIMLAFGSGLNSYIADVSNSFTNPNIVTITKKTSDPLMSMLPITAFGKGEDENIISDLNGALEKAGYEPFLTKDDLIPGYCGISLGGMQAEFSIAGYEDAEPAQITCVYSTPPYYDENNLIEGELAQNENVDADVVEIMLTYGAYANFKTITGSSDVVGKTIKLKISVAGLSTPIEVDALVTAIVDSSVIQRMTVAYVDFDVLAYHASLHGLESFPITSYYIDTEVEYADVLNKFIMSNEKYSGSVESSLTNMFSEMSSTVSVALTIIACISLVVSAIMILVVLYISVSERTREIGVLKSIGARRKDIRRIFTSESFLVGLLSGIVGIVLSIVVYIIFVVMLKATLGFAPLSLQWWYFALAIGVSVVISMLSGLYPSAKAAKLDPVESLRHE